MKSISVVKRKANVNTSTSCALRRKSRSSADFVNGTTHGRGELKASQPTHSLLLDESGSFFPYQWRLSRVVIRLFAASKPNGVLLPLAVVLLTDPGFLLLDSFNGHQPGLCMLASEQDVYVNVGSVLVVVLVVDTSCGGQPMATRLQCQGLLGVQQERQQRQEVKNERATRVDGRARGQHKRDQGGNCRDNTTVCVWRLVSWLVSNTQHARVISRLLSLFCSRPHRRKPTAEPHTRTAGRIVGPSLYVLSLL